MIINYVAFLDPFKYHGGGEQILRHLLQVGRERGHDFHFTTAWPYRRDFNAQADLTLLADVFNVPHGLPSLDETLMREIIHRHKYVHLDQAYTDLCNQDYLPCNGNSTPRCVFKSPWQWRMNLRKRDFSTACTQRKPLIQQLYRSSTMNMFHSPLHYRLIQQMLQFPLDHPHYLIKPLIDPKRFYNQGIIRDIEYLYVGVLSEAKGFYQLREQFKDKDIVMIGQTVKGIKVDFGTYLGKQAYENLPGFFNRARNFVYFPRWPDPMPRTVVEAALCGCSLSLNANVGAASWPFDLSDPSNFAQADLEFWQTLEKL